MEMPNVFVVKRYTVRNAKIRSYAVGKRKLKQNAVHMGKGVSPSL